MIKDNQITIVRDSHISWLGQVPEHWKIKRFRFAIDSIEQGWSPACDNRIADDWEWGVLKVGCVNGGKFNELENKALPENLSVRLECEIKPGDILVSRANTKELLGSTARVERIRRRLLLCDKLYRLKLKTNADPDFFVLLLGAKCTRYQFERDSSGTSSSMQNISQDKMRDFVLAFPPLEEQKSIAQFLDRKTAAIDALITKKQRLIELLEEKRSARINQAVTKGLNLDAPMKDSGIPWIGNIPKNWEITKLKWISPYITVGIVVTPSKYYVDKGVPCLRSLNIKNGEIVNENLVYITEESNEILSKSKIFKGDLVCVRTGQPGTTAVVDKNFDSANCIDLIVIRRSSKASSEYISLAMNSEVCKSQYLLGTSGAIQQHFNVETAKNLIICCPPLDEQLQIVEYCHQLTSRNKFLIKKVTDQIQKLQEYRQSVITAAVTGKLDVTQEAAS